MRIPPGVFKTEPWRTLDVHEKAFLMFLVLHTKPGQNRCDPSPSWEYFLKNLGVCKDKLSKILDQNIGLPAKGWLHIERKPHGGCRVRNIYTVLIPEDPNTPVDRNIDSRKNTPVHRTTFNRNGTEVKNLPVGAD